MRVRNQKPSRPDAGVPADRQLRDDIEADVFELWIGVSRLMSRLREAHPRPKAERRRRAVPSGP